MQTEGMVKRYFIDTEFMESGHLFPITLLSIGIVCEDGREFYAVNLEADWTLANDWVKENVIPHLHATSRLRYADSTHCSCRARRGEGA